MKRNPHTPTSAGLEQALASSTTDKRLEVLRAIGSLGSISQAARANGVSYKAAWQAIEILSNLAGTPLLEKAVGGSGGGGARLTAAGQELLHIADHLNRARAAALAQIRGEIPGAGNPMAQLAGLGLRTSMRNQLPCVINRIDTVNGAPRVWLELPDGQQLSSRITRESLELLDLAPGMPVLTMCKATAVTIAPTIVAVGEINVLKGHIAKRLGLKTDGQVSMAIGQGVQIAGFANPAAALKLKQAVEAAIAQSAIVIALAN